MVPSPNHPILIAEDDQDIAAVLSRALRAQGFQVVSAANGQEGWAQIAECPRGFYAVITDNQMPEMTGLELVKKIRTTDFAGRIVVHSGRLTGELHKEFADLRVDAILTKPTPLKEIIEALTRVSEQSCV